MPAKKSTAKRKPASGQYVMVALKRATDPRMAVIENEIRSFYGMGKKKAAATVKRSGVLTPTGKLKPVFK